MATTYQIKTFEDIYNAVLEELGIQSSDSVALNRIKRDVNAVYLEEVCPESRWSWLRKTVDLEHSAYISTGTATVTANSETVTLTTAPSYSVDGFYFIGGSFNEVYKIAGHSAGSTTLRLATKYNGTTSATATYRIWSKSVPLPANCRETIEVRQDFRGAPLENRGFQDLQKLESMSPRAQGRPIYYCTGDYVDPDDYTNTAGLTSATRSSVGLIRTIKFSSTTWTDQTDDGTTKLFQVGDRIRVTGSGSNLYNIEGVISTLFHLPRQHNFKSLQRLILELQYLQRTRQRLKNDIVNLFYIHQLTTRRQQFTSHTLSTHLLWQQQLMNH
jgi:hypothetical protein